MLAAALAYAARGWAVVPLHWPIDGGCSCSRGQSCRTPGKHPLTKHGLEDGSADPDQIRSWWRRWPRANVGIVTGRISGLLGVDIDGPRHPDAMLALLDALGPIDRDQCVGHVLTGSGGDHYYLRAPNGGPTKTGWPVKGIDLRGDGGLLVAPPSVHASGAHYSWIERSTYGDPLC